ncbi:ReoY family proteolytic degradation factor [Alteribacillus sp. YIM 98480]|uniref:ReoY family proteolytic degradation factor n=1 Tax=Alteribacillus sp. YIM 98480 TaxID=2606599 RepID=UPI00131C49C4|nr:ReoY family proteolytic degradation factor [Alteribacillus sp. YIM 98480]
MNSAISTIEKRDFLKWLLKGQHIKRREYAWILNYLLSDSHLLEHVHFVEKAEYCPKAIILSAEGLSNIPFSFHKHQYVTMDAERSFHDIRLHPDEELYVQLNFDDADFQRQYVSVLEENPYLPGRGQEKLLMEVVADIILNQAVIDFKLQTLRENIDRALEKKNKEEFYAYSKELLELKRSIDP